MSGRTWIVAVAAVVGLCWAVPAGAGTQATVQQGAVQGLPSAAGDVVLMNAFVAAVVKGDGSGVEVCANSGGGWKQRARICPAAGGKALKITGTSVTANGSAEGAVKATVEGGGALVFSVNAADPMVKATTEGKVECLRFDAPCRLGVLPDFFADDMLVDATAIPVDRTEIPSDNFFLHMVGDEEAIVAAVWEKNVRDVELSFSGQGAARKIAATDVFFGDQGSIWAAVLEGKGVWHSEELTAADSEKGKTLDWSVPFMAMWKLDFTRSDGSVSSYPLTSDKGVYERGGLKYPTHNHSLKGGKAVLVPESALLQTQWKDSTYAGPVVAYPISLYDTPPEKLCIEDLMTRCLGKTKCAYVLDADAAKTVYKGIFTCSFGKTPRMFIPDGPAFDNNLRAAQTWKSDHAFMMKETRAVADFIKYVQDRINQYVDLTADLLKYLDEAEKKNPGQAKFIGQLREELKKPSPVFRTTVAWDVRADGEKVFAPWMAEMMKAMRVDTWEQGEKGFEAGKAPEIGDPQDARVAALRLKMKIVRSRAAMEMARNPAAAEICREIRSRIEKALRNATSYERETQWVGG